MPDITLHLSTEIVTAQNLSELADCIRQIQNREKTDRIITLTCAVTVVHEESLESPSEHVVEDRCPYLRHYDETVGLWVIDRNPQEVDMSWIREHAYQIGITETDS